ncbi:acyltransferase family protein [Pyxidicoccus sp. MSG2]|uniref:acyltransferase family protein n=1 Tax=Pyxidicoccus sp. MSG2 TaxID=2996790 RepID=UPI002270F03A|nr:acyltransferase family protein [Pyxidicoccus sp. MSG2]MCY1019218.1 acyltransferase [Pyxidicoccus sp. MSG2]
MSLLENVRGVLIALVVMGHSLEPLIAREPLARALYTAFYLFHIPAFAFLSGHLSRAEWSRKALANIAWSLLAPLVIFQVLYVAFDAWVLGRGWSRTWLLQPYWLLWFLWSLACWRLVLPLLRRLPMPLLLSVIVAVGAGLLPWVGYLFGLSRTFVFLPCFVAGHLARREWLLGEGPRHRVLAAVLFVALGGGVWAMASETLAAPNPQWLYGSASYAALGVAPLTGMATRLALLGCALALTWSLFRVCPRGDSVLTLLGARSLPPFLLHGFVVRGIEKAGGFSVLHGVPGVLLSLAGGAVLALLLSHPFVVGVTRPLWEPRRLFGRV